MGLRGPRGARHGPHPARTARSAPGASTAIAALGILRDGSTGASHTRRPRVHCRAECMLPDDNRGLNVAHNPHAARVIATALGSMGFHRAHSPCSECRRQGHRRRHRGDAVRVDNGTSRFARPAQRKRVGVARRPIAPASRGAVRTFDDVALAYTAARSDAVEADRIIVFGSFLTVAAVLAAQGRDFGGLHRHG